VLGAWIIVITLCSYIFQASCWVIGSRSGQLDV
jgi:hypothetical protein